MKQKREPMPCASRSWRGFSTRHPWRDEKASAPASPPAGPYPPCPAMLGALQGGFTAAATATAEAESKAKAAALRAAALSLQLLLRLMLLRLLPWTSIPLACRRASQRSLGGEGSRLASTARCEPERHGCRLSAVRPWMACPRGTPEIARSAGRSRYASTARISAEGLALLFLASRRHAAGRIPLVTFLGRQGKREAVEASRARQREIVR